MITKITETYNEQTYSFILNNIKKLNNFWNSCGYGIIKNGTLITEPTISEFHNYYKTLSPREFRLYKAGTCWDYVEYGSYFLNTKLIKNHKYYIYTTLPDGDTHTFILIPYKDKYLYTEGAWKDLANKIDTYKIFSNPVKAFKYITEEMFTIPDNEDIPKFNYYIWEYHSLPNYGLTAQEFTEFIILQEPIYEGTTVNPNFN